MSLFPIIFVQLIAVSFSCVCMCVLSSYLFWTSGSWTYQPGSHRRKVTQDFSSTFLLRCLPYFLRFPSGWCAVVVVVFFALTDRASTIPSNIRGCQSGTWSQRGTKVNGSHHGDNPLLRPTGIQIATKSYGTPQAMATTNNIKTVHQTSLLHIY